MGAGKIYLSAKRRNGNGGRRKSKAVTLVASKRSYRKPLPTMAPRSKLLKLRYGFFDIALSSNIGSVGGHIFRANSIQDPDQTGIGHRVRGFDQWMTFYDHYCVLGSKITCNYAYEKAGNTTSPSGMISMLIKDSFVVPTSTNVVQESRYVKTRIINNQIGSKRIVSSFSAKKFFGRRKGTLLNDARLTGTDTTDPAEEVAFILTYTALNGNTSLVFCSGYIDYIVVLFEPKQPPES